VVESALDKSLVAIWSNSSDQKNSVQIHHLHTISGACSHLDLEDKQAAEAETTGVQFAVTNRRYPA
jgi:hypothetical protein